MITAIIRNKENTLVLDFPRSIYDLYEKLQSVGIITIAPKSESYIRNITFSISSACIAWRKNTRPVRSFPNCS